MTVQKFYAHSKPGIPEEEWQELREHLQNTAFSAKEFASIFGAGDWGETAGLMHDIGKYSQEFQAILKQSVNEEANDDQQRGPDHSSAGAQELAKRFPRGEGRLLAYAVAGHHVGLLDGKGNDACLEKRLTKKVKDYGYWLRDGLNAQQKLVLPSGILQKDNSVQLVFFTAYSYKFAVGGWLANPGDVLKLIFMTLIVATSGWLVYKLAKDKPLPAYLGSS